MRGNRQAVVVVQSSSGSIPACAGEPSASSPWCNRTAVYPRVCGGTARAAGVVRVFYGLSPRVRGNLFLTEGDILRSGSIPACAGEPLRNLEPSTEYEVYPRVCGGTNVGFELGCAVQGLSPRVRGNRQGNVRVRSNRGSIPACAGEPGSRRCGGEHTGSIPACAGEPVPQGTYQTISSVYPRVCGGTKRGDGETWYSYGLSPRVRGNPSVPKHCVGS